MSFKNDEKETARRFLIELGTPVQEMLTLKEFASRDPDPNFNIEHLDSVCPDIVAITAADAIGLELTAYTHDNLPNQISAVLSDLSEVGDQIAGGFPDLRGFQIHVSPNTTSALRQRDARPLAVQVFEFVHSEQSRDPLHADQDRYYSARISRNNRHAFEDWPLLGQHLQSIAVHSRSALQDEPVALYGGFGLHFGTQLEAVAQTIVTKGAKLKSGYTRGLAATWLLIHADGKPRSSRIAPMWSDETERVLNSSVRQSADESGFDQVYLWDGVRGGFVELRSGRSSVVAPT
jgi:hypothetical protein